MDHIADIIRRLMENLEGEKRAMAVRAGALPVAEDMGGCLMIRPDLSVVALSWWSDEIAPVDEWWQKCARIEAARKYEALRDLMPQKPHDASVCKNCGGTGSLDDQIEGLEAVRPSGTGPLLQCGDCFGLGWVANDEDELS